MKKLRFVVPTLVLAVAMMGAGYAAWSTQLTVTNTVDTGSFGFVFTAPASSTVTFTGNIVGGATGSVGNTSASVDTITLSNLFPGVGTVIDLPITNSSSIPATLTPGTISPALPTGLTATPTLWSVGSDQNHTLTSVDFANVLPANTSLILRYTFVAASTNSDATQLPKSGTVATTYTIQPTFTQNTQ